MAGSLIKIDEAIVTSAVASVTLTGIDSTYDVYMVAVNNVQPATDNVTLKFRVTKSGVEDSTANYDVAHKFLNSTASFSNGSTTNATEHTLSNNGTGTSETLQGIMYLFNFNSASEYSFWTNELTNFNASAQAVGQQGGAVHTVASASDGVHFYMSAGNIASGTFTLYGLKK